MELTGWAYAESAREPFVLKEIRKLKLSITAIGKLERAMHRVETGTTIGKEISLVRGSIWELRFQVDKRWYRLLYARKSGKYVALHLLAKKRNDLDNSSIELSEQRLKEH